MKNPILPILCLLACLISHPLQAQSTCEQPRDLRLDIESPQSVKVSWELVSDAPNFLVQYFHIQEQKQHELMVNEPYARLEELHPNTAYEVWIVAICENSLSPESEKLIFTTPPLPCTFPEVVHLGAYTETATLLLRDATDIQTYQIDYRQIGSPPNSWNTVDNDRPDFFILGLLPDTEYLLRSRGYCPTGWSEYSPTTTFSTDGPANPGNSAKLENYEMLTEDYLVLHFDEGAVIFFQMGQEPQDDVLLKTRLDTDRATNPSTFTISSQNDTYYQTPRHPLEIGRKSKGDDFSSIWYEYPYGQDHWLYLKLPRALERGKSYEIALGGMATNVLKVDITFNEFKNRSEAIHVNQIGYVPTAQYKYGYVSAWLGDMGGLNLDQYDNAPFYLVNDADGLVVFNGTMQQRYDFETADPENYNGTENAVGYYATDVWECDFSAFDTPGKYRLVVEGIGCSFPFKIQDDVYREPFKTVARSLYHHRSGIDRSSNYTVWTKPIDHRPGLNGFTAEYSNWRYMDGSEAFTELPANATGILMPEAYGGWMDAGDFDRKALHLRVSNMFLLLYELAPEKFTDGELVIPESGNGIPDLIDEAHWGIDLFRRLTGPTGGICGGIEAEDHPAAGQASWTDTLKWYVYAEEPKASYTFAASAVQLAFCLELAGVDSMSNDLLAEALAAYNWANANLLTGDEPLVRDERAFAAAWLYKYTGQLGYENQFLQDLRVLNDYDPLINYDGQNSYDQEYAVWTYITTNQPDMDLQVKKRLENAALNWATSNVVDPAELRACRMGFGMWSPSVIGIGSTTPLVMPAIIAYEISGEKPFLDYLYTTCDYYLGGNPLNMTWVTGLGYRFPTQILNLDSWFDGIGASIPGIVPYGIQSPSLDWNNGGVYSPGYVKSSAYPANVYEWPTHELYFESRYTPITNEYTIWQNMGPAAVAYGYLTAEAPNPNTRLKYLMADENLSLEPNFQISPNPAYDHLNLQLQQTGIYHLQLRDGTGKVWRDQLFEGKQYNLDMEALPAGLYTIQLLNEQGNSTTRKVVKAN